jgi:hypothetical protein
LPEKIQCPCGRVIGSSSEYKVLYLKKELHEIDILCPNDTCYLRELGYVRFDMHDKEAKFKDAAFYPPFVTWNSGRMGHEKAEKALKSHLKEIVTKQIDWDRISKGTTV